MKRCFVFLLSIFVILSISCNEKSNPTESNDPEGAKQDILAANTALAVVLYNLVNSDSINNPADIDFTEPYNLYQSAYNKDNTNPDANFGIALTGILTLSQDQQIIDAFNEWDSYLETGNPFEKSGYCHFLENVPEWALTYPLHPHITHNFTKSQEYSNRKDCIGLTLLVPNMETIWTSHLHTYLTARTWWNPKENIDKFRVEE